MLDVTSFNEYNIKLNSVIGNDTRCTKIEGGGNMGKEEYVFSNILNK